MRCRRIWTHSLAALAALALFASLAHGVIKVLTPLKSFVADSQFIVVAKVDKLYPEKPALILTVSDDLKGKLPYRRLPINLVGDSEAKKEKHVPALLKRLAPDLPVILFVHQRGKALTTFAYTNGTCVHILGRITGDDSASWSFTHCEPYLRRTYKGTTAELRQVLAAAISGKKDPPPVNEKEPPGFGPEIPEKKTSCGDASGW